MHYDASSRTAVYNNDSWTVPKSGFYIFRSSESASGAACVYAFDLNIETNYPIATIANVAGTGGLSYSCIMPAIKGHTIKVFITGYTCAIRHFISISS